METCVKHQGVSGPLLLCDNTTVKMLQSRVLLILTLAIAAHSEPRDPIPKERASAQNGQHLDQDADHGLPWEEHKKQSFFPRQPQRHPRPADSRWHDSFPPTRTSNDFVPTRTYTTLMRRAPQATFTCVPEMNCYTFTCEFLGSHPSRNSSWKKNHVLTAAVLGPTSVQVSPFNA